MLAAFVTVCTAIGLSAQTSAATPQNSATSFPQAPRLQFSPGALLRAELDKTVDVKKVKVGDVVVVKLTDDLKSNGEVLAPKGSEILAHVTQAAQHQGDAPSVLGIAFDKLKLKDGSDISFQATIQAVGFPDEASGSEDIAGGNADARQAGPAVCPDRVGRWVNPAVTRALECPLQVRAREIWTRRARSSPRTRKALWGSQGLL